MPRHLTLLLALLVAVNGASIAGQRPAGPVPRQPARAQNAVDPLTASIQGRVVSADTGAPIRRAEVRAMNERNMSRLVTTDGDGRFDLRDLPAGEYRLTASKTGYVSLSYGQRRPFEAAEAIKLAQGQKAAANLLLPRAGAIGGRVVDEAGEPLAQTRVQALRSRMVEGRRRLQPAGPIDLTDDTGAFRLYGLAPGEYYVSATPREPAEPIDAGGSAGRAFKSTMTTYYPGTGSLEEAVRVAVGVSGESRADIQLGSTRAATVSGIVLSADGRPAGDAQISLQSEIVSMGVSAIITGPPPTAVSTHSEPDGTFTLPGVPPGPYVLQVSVEPDFSSVVPDQNVGITTPVDLQRLLPAGEHASMPIVVGGADIAGLTITTSGGGALEGAFVRDSAATQPLPRGLSVQVSSTTHGAVSRMQNAEAGTFRLLGLRGPVHLAVSGLPEGWAVKAITIDGGIDVTDQPIEAKNGQTLNARIVLTDRITEISGTVAPASAADTGRRDHSVVVFAVDPEKWRYPSRYLRSVRADEQGAFTISALPGDERYLAVAVTYLEEGEGSDPEFLERMRERATAFTLEEGGRRTVDLRVIER
jgi:hypothetical protein